MCVCVCVCVCVYVCVSNICLNDKQVFKYITIPP